MRRMLIGCAGSVAATERVRLLALRVFIVILTACDNVGQNALIEFFLVNDIFDTLLRVLSSGASTESLPYEALFLLAVLCNYRKYETANPYVRHLTDTSDELVLNAIGMLISRVFLRYNQHYARATNVAQQPAGLLSRITALVGSMFTESDAALSTDEAMYVLDCGRVSVVADACAWSGRFCARPAVCYWFSTNSCISIETSWPS